MVNRRHIRIKVMQSVYAVLQSKSDNLPKEEKFLLYNIQKATELYVLQLLLLVEIRNLSLQHLEIKKNKYLATPEDKNPNLKFVNNSVIQAIINSVEINDYVAKKKLTVWEDHREYVRILLDQLLASDLYLDYIESVESSFEEDKLFVLDMFKKNCCPQRKTF